MKKVLMIIMLAAVALSLAYAEPAFGMRGGINITNREYSGDNDFTTGARTGFHAGLVMQYRAPLNIIVQPELLYSQKGYTYDGLLIDHRFNYDYVELPIAIKYDINLKGFHLQPFVAPQAGYALVAKDIQDNVLDILDGELNMIDDINRINYGVDLGLDIMALDDLMLGARYQIGLSDIGVNMKADIHTHRGWMFSIGYLF